MIKTKISHAFFDQISANAYNKSKVSKLVSTKRVLWTSFFVDSLDVSINVLIAIITGSAVMLAEALQGLADLTSVTMLLIGYSRSKKRSNKQHPFGYGKEQYFWALVSIFLILGVTSTLSFYSGFMQWRHPDSVNYLGLAYFTLIISVTSNGYAFMLSLRKVLGKTSIKSLPKIFFESADVSPKTTLALDAAGTLAALFGLSALITYGVTGNPKFDGLGAMVIGILLATLAITLLVTTRSLVTGKSAPKKVNLEIASTTTTIPEVLEVLDLKTMVLGADNLLINMRVHLKDDLSTDEIEVVIDNIKNSIRKKVSAKTHITIEPETPPKRRSR